VGAHDDGVDIKALCGMKVREKEKSLLSRRNTREFLDDKRSNWPLKIQNVG
jgi:hypothetical protein